MEACVRRVRGRVSGAAPGAGMPVRVGGQRHGRRLQPLRQVHRAHLVVLRAQHRARHHLRLHRLVHPPLRALPLARRLRPHARVFRVPSGLQGLGFRHGEPCLLAPRADPDARQGTRPRTHWLGALQATSGVGKGLVKADTEGQS